MCMLWPRNHTACCDIRVGGVSSHHVRVYFPTLACFIWVLLWSWNAHLHQDWAVACQFLDWSKYRTKACCHFRSSTNTKLTLNGKTSSSLGTYLLFFLARIGKLLCFKVSVPMCVCCRISQRCLAVKPSTLTKERNPVTSSFQRVTSSSCDARWMTIGTTASLTVVMVSCLRVTSSYCVHWAKLHPKAKHCMTLRSKIKTRIKTAWPSAR